MADSPTHPRIIAPWRHPRYEFTGDPPRQGGFASVYKARDLHFPESKSFLAIKHFQHGEDPEQFAQEAQRHKSLSDRCHYVVDVRDYWSEDHDGRLRHFLAMEWVEENLADFIRERWQELPIPYVLSLVMNIASGLQTMRAEGLAHGDLKPSNVMMLPDGTPQLNDFGIVTRILNSDPIKAFSPGYAPREQVLGLQSKKTKERVDLFPLGAICFQLLTGQHPFFSENDHRTTKWREIVIDREPPKKVADLRPETARWPGLEELLASLLNHDPERRPASVETVHKAFARIREAGETKADAQGVRTLLLQFALAVVTAIGTATALSDEAPAVSYFRLKSPSNCVASGRAALEWRTSGATVEIRNSQGVTRKSLPPAGTLTIETDDPGTHSYDLRVFSRRRKYAETAHIILLIRAKGCLAQQTGESK